MTIPPGVAVDAVAERRRERLLARRIVFAIAVEVGFDVTNQRVYLLVVVRMYDNTRLLVDEQYVLVSYTISRWGVRCVNAVSAASSAKKLVRDEQLDAVALAKHISDIGALSVDLDFLRAYEFVQERLRQRLHGFREEFVESLTRVVFGYI